MLVELSTDALYIALDISVGQLGGKKLLCSKLPFITKFCAFVVKGKQNKITNTYLITLILKVGSKFTAHF